MTSIRVGLSGVAPNALPSKMPSRWAWLLGLIGFFALLIVSSVFIGFRISMAVTVAA